MGGRAAALPLTFALGVVPAFAAAGAPAGTDANASAHQRLALEVLRELVETDTTQRNGSGRAAEALAARLRAAGFGAGDVHVVGPRPEKRNLVVRLRGQGAGKPILFLAHLDVVEARREDWSEGLDPFRLTERDGFLYGRGTVDVKDEAAALVAALIRLREEGFVPARDVVVALTDDEEGGDANGVLWLLENRRELIDAAFCINTDAGGGQLEDGRRVRYTLQTGEKVFLTFTLEVKSPGGHSSLPGKDNAIYRLADALARLARFEFPARLNETTRAFFERMAARESGDTAADMRAAARVPPDAAAIARLSAGSPFYNGIVRTTCVATMLEAGHAPNALPQTARATVNCRLLPEDDQANVESTLRRVLADPQVTLTAHGEARPAASSPLVPEVLGPVERLVGETWPGVPVVPVMDPWSTDGLHLRRAGIPVYGAPGVFYEVDPVRSHGKDERVGVQAFREGVEFVYRLVRTLASAP
jgi:acetylornithine deacetylase/succinyl-diaminopimelate desuccinylase-like protein